MSQFEGADETFLTSKADFGLIIFLLLRRNFSTKSENQ